MTSPYKVKIRKGKRGWWITGYPCGPVGPYDTKTCDEFEDDLASMKRFFSKQSNRKLYEEERKE